MKNRKIVSLLLALCMLVSVTAAVAETPKAGGKLTAYFTSFPTTCFLPASSRAGDRVSLWPAVEQLGRTNMDGSIQPFLAESFASDPEKLTFTIKVRDGIFFHDGSKLTAEVVKWNMEKYIESGKGSEICNPDSIEVTDELTVVAHFPTFNNSWETSIGIIAMCSKEAYEKNGADYMATHAVGTGAFTLDTFSLNERLVFKKNPSYWQEGKPYLDEIEILFINENTTLVSAFLNNEVQVIQQCSEGVVVSQLSAAGFENQTAESSNNYSTTYCVPNSFDPESPWANDSVRIAVFNHGIDWDGLAYALTGGLGKASQQWGVAGSMNFDPDAVRGEYNPETAKAMLTNAGYPDGFSTILWTSNSTENRDRATLLQAALSMLGITSEIKLYDDGVLGQMRTENSPGIYITEGPSFLDMSNYLNNNFSPTGSKYTKIVGFSDEYVNALKSAFSATTFEEKSAALKTASRLLFVDEAKVITMAVLPAYSFVQKNVHDMGLRQATAYEFTPETCWVD